MTDVNKRPLERKVISNTKKDVDTRGKINYLSNNVHHQSLTCLLLSLGQETRHQEKKKVMIVRNVT